MLRLILDRSAGSAGFALAQEERVICKKVWEGDGVRSPAWFMEMADLIRSSGYSVTDVDEFVCGIGPGSFSGIRAALSALEGMALPGRKPVLGISGAAVLAVQMAREGVNTVTVIGDARRSRLWSVSYQLDRNGRIRELANGGEVTHSAADFELLAAAELSARVPPGSLILSPDWERIGGVLTENFSPERLMMQTASPDIEVMARLVSRQPAQCRPEPLPIYLHPAVVVKL